MSNDESGRCRAAAAGRFDDVAYPRLAPTDFYLAWQTHR